MRDTLRTALNPPSLNPPPRTEATARTVARLDRAAKAALRVCWLVINAALWTSVRLVLVLERWRGIGAESRSGWVRRQERYGYDFHCGWCASVTPEGNEFERTCCAMACDEYWRRTEPALFEQWTGRSA